MMDFAMASQREKLLVVMKEDMVAVQMDGKSLVPLQETRWVEMPAVQTAVW